MSEPTDVPLDVRIEWPVDAAGAAVAINQMLLLAGPNTSQGPDGISYLLLGHVAPPVLLDMPAIQDFTKDTGRAELQVDVRARLVMTRQRLMELREIIDRHLAGGGEGAQ